RRHAGDHGADRPGHPGDVDDEHHRAPGEPGDVGGGGIAVGAQAPVVQAHDSLDDRDVRAAGTVPQQRHHQLLAHQVRVEVAAGPAGGDGVVPGVDVVRADLVPG